MKHILVIFAQRFEYAKRQGFEGGIDEYILQEYEAYVQTCVRCGIMCKGFEEWKEGVQKAHS
jgi:hypothetical protein